MHRSHLYNVLDTAKVMGMENISVVAWDQGVIELGRNLTIKGHY